MIYLKEGEVKEMFSVYEKSGIEGLLSKLKRRGEKIERVAKALDKAKFYDFEDDKERINIEVCLEEHEFYMRKLMAAEIYGQLGWKGPAGFCYDKVGRMAYHLGERSEGKARKDWLNEAVEWKRKALDIFMESGKWQAAGYTAFRLSQIYKSLKKEGTSKFYFNKSKELFGKAGVGFPFRRKGEFRR